LNEAIESARALWKREKRTPVSDEVAARAFGYSSLSGRARTKLAALRQFGLVESAGKGTAVSPLALEILHNPTDSDAYLQAVRQAALKPALFRELFATHADASNEALRSVLLVSKKFSEEGADTAIKSFRDTLAVAKLPDAAFAAPEAWGNTEIESNEPNPSAGWGLPSQAATIRPGLQQRAPLPVDFAAVVLSFTLPYGDTTLHVRIEAKGQPLKREHVAKIRKYLELAEDDLPSLASSPGRSTD
jgi:hypothetical protein